MRTGGGPPMKPIEVDPAVAAIAGHVMNTAPVLFSSNFVDSQSDILKDGQNDFQLIPASSDQFGDGDVIKDGDLDHIGEVISFGTNINVIPIKIDNSMQSQGHNSTALTQTLTAVPDKRSEKQLRLERIRQLMHQDKQSAALRIQQDEILIAHLKRKCDLEIEELTAKAKLAKLLLKHQEEKTEVQ